MIDIPIGGNCYPVAKYLNQTQIGVAGIRKWTSPSQEFVVYLYLSKIGSLEVQVELEAIRDRATLIFSIDAVSHVCEVKEAGMLTLPVGEWHLNSFGYKAIHIRLEDTSVGQAISLSRLSLSGSSIDANTIFVPNGADFYFCRRGVSVYIGYVFPSSLLLTSAHTTTTVPLGYDSIGSFFADIRWDYGYIGLQTISDSERWIIFSIWNPEGNNSHFAIPEQKRVVQIDFGENVDIEPFGNEGSGLKSFIRYDWKTNHSYSFFVHVDPVEESHSIFSGYFFDPEKKMWKLISKIKAPVPRAYLKDLSSFIECFYPDYGDQPRGCKFSSQWVKDNMGQWHELNNAEVRPTQESQYRLDFSARDDDDAFFIHSGGFFNGQTLPEAKLTRVATSNVPLTPA